MGIERVLWLLFGDRLFFLEMGFSFVSFISLLQVVVFSSITTLSSTILFLLSSFLWSTIGTTCIMVVRFTSTIPMESLYELSPPFNIAS